MLDLVPDKSCQADWGRIEAFPWVAAMRACPQNPQYHAEGNVWTHTRMVVEALLASEQWQSGAFPRPAAMFLSCLLHDIGKPECTRIEDDGRITSKGHSGIGEAISRRLLWQAGVPFEVREPACLLTRFHQLPFNFLRSRDVERDIIRTSLLCPLPDLCALASFDNQGRRSQSQSESFDAIEMFRTVAHDEHACYKQPPSFATDHARFMYLHGQYHRTAEAFDDCRFDVVMLSGFPGAGKDTWIRRNYPDWPVISLDEIRKELRIKPTDSQSAVAHKAKSDARELMRQSRSFVFNATNLSRRLRTEWIEHFRQYAGRIHITYIEPDHATLLRQNAQREAAVPDAVIEHLARDWQVPTIDECHTLRLVVTDAPAPTSTAGSSRRSAQTHRSAAPGR